MLRVPSNVSTRIKQLEDELGFPLLLRAHRAISLSPDGRQFLGYAQRILALVGEAKGLRVHGAPRGSLKLGALCADLW
ncbi:LysR family transcriptional regulator [Microbacterium saperdae]